MQIDHEDIIFQVEASPRKSVKDFLLKRTNSTKQLNNYVPASTIEAFNRYFQINILFARGGQGAPSRQGGFQALRSFGTEKTSVFSTNGTIKVCVSYTTVFCAQRATPNGVLVSLLFPKQQA